MKVQWIPLLLADPSPSLRLQVMRELLAREDNEAEICELAELQSRDPLVISLLEKQLENGSWPAADDRAGPGSLRGTAHALVRAGTLGLDREHPAIKKGVAFLFAHQSADGSWPLTGDLEEGERASGYDMIPLQTALPLRGIAAAGYATDPRAERAYAWLLEQRLEDGAWPTGVASGVFGRVAGYRRLPHSRWGCRSNTTGALLCFAHHPQRRTGIVAQRALDHLLAIGSRERQNFGFEMARAVGAEKASGLFTYFARFDTALLLQLCWRVGVSVADDRVANLVAAVRGLSGPYGLWEYRPQPQISRWVTFDVLRSLLGVGELNFG